MRKIIPPQRIKSAWQRYAEGERLIPTFERIIPKSNVSKPRCTSEVGDFIFVGEPKKTIPPPPKPQEPKRINYWLYEVEKFGFIITLIFCICTLILTIARVIYDIIIK